MATTCELFAEEGLTGVTVDAVARRSGAAKTTICRHWPSHVTIQGCPLRLDIPRRPVDRGGAGAAHEVVDSQLEQTSQGGISGFWLARRWRCAARTRAMRDLCSALCALHRL